MAKLADAYGSGPYAARLAGSNPALPTKMKNYKKFIRKAFVLLLPILLILLFINFAYLQYRQIQNTKWCNEFMQNYVKNPPLDISEFTHKDILFDEVCSPTNYLYGFWPIVAIGALTYIAKKTKKTNDD